MTRQWMAFFAVAVLVAATAGVGSAQGVSNGDIPLVFEDWRMHFMQPPSRINETDVTVWLSPDGRMAITNPTGTLSDLRSTQTRHHGGSTRSIWK